MPFTPSKPLFNITASPAKSPVRKATASSILNRPKLTTEQALKGYDYLKSHSSRNNSGS